MRDSVSTPAGTETVVKRAADELGEVLRDAALCPEASVAEVTHNVRRLLLNTAVAVSTGNQGNKHILVLALTDVIANAGAIEQTATRTLEALLGDDPGCGRALPHGHSSTRPRGSGHR